jgi:hypothetical protein
MRSWYLDKVYLSYWTKYGQILFFSGTLSYYSGMHIMRNIQKQKCNVP